MKLHWSITSSAENCRTERRDLCCIQILHLSFLLIPTTTGMRRFVNCFIPNARLGSVFWGWVFLNPVMHRIRHGMHLTLLFLSTYLPPFLHTRCARVCLVLMRVSQKKQENARQLRRRRHRRLYVENLRRLEKRRRRSPDSLVSVLFLLFVFTSDNNPLFGGLFVVVQPSRFTHVIALSDAQLHVCKPIVGRWSIKGH